jgi:hypothetical protein
MDVQGQVSVAVVYQKDGLQTNHSASFNGPINAASTKAKAQLEAWQAEAAEQ